jgi:chemotaxis receptor (MCP) glutamine deamidase CheD
MSPIDHDPRELERRARNINPGTVETERQITTLLCSCVAVCLYDARLRLAGMNHFLLPSRSLTSTRPVQQMLSDTESAFCAPCG